MPASGQAPPRALRRSLGFLLAKAAQRGAALVAEALEPSGLKARHYGVLVTLAEDDGLTQQELGQRLSIDRTTITAVVDDLQRRGYALRKPDPSDRRAYNVSLTEAGRQGLADIKPRVEQAVHVFEAALSPTQRRQMARLAVRLAQVPWAHQVGESR
jgi:MarR family transcriptional regulator, lower aerobic nicotinate degradation pathway regulator